MTSSYEGKDAHASAKRFQGRDGETAGFEVYGRGGMAGLQREVDPDAFSTEERGLAHSFPFPDEIILFSLFLSFSSFST